MQQIEEYFLISKTYNHTKFQDHTFLAIITILPQKTHMASAHIIYARKLEHTNVRRPLKI
jgi:hypothetical protein